MRSLRDLTQHLTTRADDSRAPPVFLSSEEEQGISTLSNQCQGLVRKENLDKEELGPTFLAERMHISPRQFSRKFKDLSGITPSDFIKKYRMEKAAQLLLETDMSIQEVIESIGISSRPYFYKEFADKYGTTPKNYRAHHKAGTLTESES